MAGKQRNILPPVPQGYGLDGMPSDCWKRSDNRKAFERGLEEHGFFLARGDKRGFVILDHGGNIHSLPRALGLKTKDVRARMAM